MIHSTLSSIRYHQNLFSLCFLYDFFTNFDSSSYNTNLITNNKEKTKKSFIENNNKQIHQLFHNNSNNNNNINNNNNNNKLTNNNNNLSSSNNNFQNNFATVKVNLNDDINEENFNYSFISKNNNDIIPYTTKIDFKNSNKTNSIFSNETLNSDLIIIKNINDDNNMDLFTEKEKINIFNSFACISVLNLCTLITSNDEIFSNLNLNTFQSSNNNIYNNNNNKNISFNSNYKNNQKNHYNKHEKINKLRSIYQFYFNEAMHCKSVEKFTEIIKIFCRYCNNSASRKISCMITMSKNNMKVMKEKLKFKYYKNIDIFWKKQVLVHTKRFLIYY
jgi:hypothetical protein